MRNLSSYPNVLTVKDIAEYLNIGRGQAYELVHSHQFRVVRVGSRILIPRKSFQRWFEGVINDNED